MRVLECSSQTEGWPQVLAFIDKALECRSFLAAFDGNGTALPQFGGQRSAQDLGGLLEQIETEDGPSALQFLLSEASLFFPYCKTSLDRPHTGNTEVSEPAAHQSTLTEETSANANGQNVEDQLKKLRRAPGLVSPIWRTDRSTILFGCLFTSHHPQTIDVALARETFREIVKALAPGLNLHFQLEQQRQNSQFNRVLLSASDSPAVLINSDRDILAQTPTCLEALRRADAATQQRQKLLVKNKQLDAALLELAVANRHTPDRPVPGVGKYPQRAICVAGPDGLLKRILIKTVYPTPPSSDRFAPPLFILRLSETRDVPKDVEKCLQDHFDLSQSEAHLARHLTVTGSMNATVEDLGITRNTAKTHLRRIYEKTGNNTQLQLAKLVHRLAQLF